MSAVDHQRKLARRFLESPTCTRLAKWDAEVSSSCISAPQVFMPSGLRDVQVYTQMGWGDVYRAGQACELLDREMRRCGSAYVKTRASTGVDAGQPLISPHDRFLQFLGEYPAPLPRGAAGLIVAEAKAPPLTLRLTRPDTDSWGLFAYAPALTLGYAMSGFGGRFSIERLWGYTTLKTDLPLEWFQCFLESGDPSFDIEGKTSIEADDIPEADLRTITRAGGHRDDLHVVVQRFEGGNVDLYHAWI